MKVKRLKQSRKTLRLYRIVIGLEAPYRVLVDGNVIFQATRMSIDLHDAFARILHCPDVEVLVPASVLAELAQLGAPAKEALKVANRLPRLPDAEVEGATEGTTQPSTAPAPAAGIVWLTKDGNPEQYMVATQDVRLRAKMRRTGKVPTLYLNQNVVVMEPPPPGFATPRAPSTGAALAAAAAAEGHKERVGGRKRKVGGPNPLSVKSKKKMPRPAEGGEGGKRNRRRTKKAAPEGGEGGPAPASAAAAAGEGF